MLRSIACAALAAGSIACAARTPSASEPASMPEQSAFEARWSGACGARARVGQCPSELTRVLYFKLDDGAAGTYSHTCTAVAPGAVQDVKAALEPEREALRRCFEPGQRDAWVAVNFHGRPRRTATSPIPTEVMRCVRARVEHALQGVNLRDTQEVIVQQGHPFGDPIDGNVKRPDIRKLIETHIGEVRACYLEALRSWPDLKGKLIVRFVIAPDGRVAIAEVVESSLRRPALECCVATKLQSWRFGAPKSGGIEIVTYPFVLEQR